MSGQLEQENDELRASVEVLENEAGYLLDEISGLEIENNELKDRILIYQTALEDISELDETHSVETAAAMALTALEEGDF